jgi:hypothetical protein
MNPYDLFNKVEEVEEDSHYPWKNFTHSIVYKKDGIEAELFMGICFFNSGFTENPKGQMIVQLKRADNMQVRGQTYKDMSVEFEVSKQRYQVEKNDAGSNTTFHNKEQMKFETKDYDEVLTVKFYHYYH